MRCGFGCMFLFLSWFDLKFSLISVFSYDGS